MKPDLYVFDLDGTLLDTLPDIGAALNAALVDHQRRERSLGEIRGFLGDGARELVHRAAGAVTAGELDALVVAYRAHYRRALVSLTKPYDGVVETLATLGVASSVLTNKPGLEAREIVKGVGLAKFFVEVVGEGDGLPRKPDPRGLRAIVDRAGAQRPIYVGDSVVDAETARAAGVEFLFAEWGYGVAPDGVTRIARFSDVKR